MSGPGDYFEGDGADLPEPEQQVEMFEELPGHPGGASPPTPRPSGMRANFRMSKSHYVLSSVKRQRLERAFREGQAVRNHGVPEDE